MKTLLIGNGAAGSKAAMEAVVQGVLDEKDVILVNSTSKDMPKEFGGKTIILSSQDTGCGKERHVAKQYAENALKKGLFNFDNIGEYTTVIFATSVEGGTGSGSTPILAKFFNQVHKKNVHIIAFTGFEDDVRGLANTIDFFKEVDSNLIIQAISNKSFMREAMQNKFKAEEMANLEMCKRIRVLTGMDFIDSKQNIDDTDILKVSNTSGYMTVDKHYLDRPLETQDDFNALIKKMIYNSKSVKSANPGAVRLGVILNIDPMSEDAVDYTFSSLKEAYGNPYECFMQEQWDGKKEYVAFIASGMKMPVDELKAIHEKYEEMTAKVNKNVDEFYKELESMNLEDQDKMFDMIKPKDKSSMSIDDFLKNN